MGSPSATAKTVFLEALEIASSQARQALLDGRCGGDVELRREVEELLRHHEQINGFLEMPPTAVANLADTVPVETAHRPTLQFLAAATRAGSLGRLGHYEILEVIGCGGFGVVLKAFDDKLQRVVAIKTLAEHLAASPTARARFIREAQSAAAVRHDNVVTIHAVEENGPVPYLVMELVDGVSLEEKLKAHGPPELREILRIGLQMAEGLAAAHRQGLVHRDVKPANILLENGVQRVKISDFGLARAVDDASLTQTGLIAGTPSYMSPEQARGEPVDSRSDLFSLGSVLYALCTGRAPFPGNSSLAVAKKVCEETPRPIAELNPAIPEWLFEIVERLHAKDPAKRFQSAEEVAGLLGSYLAQVQQASMGLPVVVTGRRSKTAPGQQRRWQPSPNVRRWLAVVAAALVLAGVTLGLTEARGVTQLAATIIRIFTPEGTLVVEVDDPAVKVTLEGDGDLVVSGAGPHELRLKPGNYRWKATRDGRVIKQDLVEITRGGKRTLRVSREETGEATARRAATAIPETNAPAVAPPPDPARPFVVLSPSGAFKRELTGLQAAISEATSGDIIEIRGDGPYLTPPSSAAGKALSIRAGHGFRPVLKLDLGQVGPEAKVTMLRTTAPLVVEGIEFHVYRTGLLPPPKINAPLGQCTCLQADAAALRVANCRFLGLGNVLAIDAHYTPDLEIRNSLLLSGNNTLYASLRGPAQVRIENNLILADIAPLRLHVDGRQPNQTSLSIMRNTLLGYYGIAWSVHEWESSLEAQSKSATKLTRCEVAENLCCSQVTQALFNSCFDPDRPIKPRLPNPDELQQALRTLIEWNERDNGYSDHPLSSGQLVSTGDVSGTMHPLATTLDDWSAFWGLKDTGSAIGTVRFIDGDMQQLLRSSKESLLPASFLLKNDSFGYRADKNQRNLGADVSLVGPGAAYERWQTTPEYAEWRRTATPVTATLPAKQTGAFVVLGGKAVAERKFDTLAEAVLKSGEGDTIEIRGNGPFATEPIKLSSRRTIRAGQGFHPVITMEPATSDRAQILLTTNAPLVLEGLEFQGTAKPTVLEIAISSTGAPLYVANSRFTSCEVMIQRTPSCQLRNSQFSDTRYYAVQCSEGSAVVLENNILASGGAIVSPLALLSPENVQRMEITRNVFTSSSATAGSASPGKAGIHLSLRLPRSTQTTGPSPLRFSQNILSGMGSILYCNHSSMQGESTQSSLAAAEYELLLRERISWHDEQNLYPMGTMLLSLSQTLGPKTKTVGPTQSLKTLAEWNQFWGQSNTGSIQGAVRFQGGDAIYSTPHKVSADDFRLRSDSAGYRAGPDGKDLGPDIDIVGPGAAYERWKQTPDYEKWLKETGQIRAEIPVAQAGAFVILSGSGIAERKCDTLAEAVEKSSNGDTIEIRGNGPFVTPQLTIATALTIRAGAGYRPVIQAAQGVESARPPNFVVARRPLTLEGLEFQGPATGGSECRFSVQDGACYVANCRFSKCTLELIRAPQYQVRNSHFSTTRSTALSVSSAVPPGPTQVVDNNLLTNMLSAWGPGARIDIRRNLIMGTQGSVAVAAANPNRKQLPVGLHLTRNIIVGSPVLRFSEAAAGPLRTTAASAAELEAVLRTGINWRDNRNLYSEGARFFTLSCATGRTSGGGYVFASVEPSRPYNTLLEWNEFWGQSNTGAIQGRVQFQGGDAALAAPFTLQPDDFRLRTESAGYRAGPDGEDLGPDIDLVGPGAAYERWKTTPEYQKWLEETGQKNKTGR